MPDCVIDSTTRFERVSDGLNPSWASSSNEVWLNFGTALGCYPSSP
jgi:hypothetical protein